MRALILPPQLMTSYDDIIRARIVEVLASIPGAGAWLTDVEFEQGKVMLTGMVQEERALEQSREAVAEIAFAKGLEGNRAATQTTWT